MANAALLQTDWHLFSSEQPGTGCIIVYWDVDDVEDTDCCFISTELTFSNGKLWDSDFEEVEYPANAIWSYWPNPT